MIHRAGINILWRSQLRLPNNYLLEHALLERVIGDRNIGQMSLIIIVLLLDVTLDLLDQSGLVADREHLIVREA
jgi:hypothetical protein